VRLNLAITYNYKLKKILSSDLTQSYSLGQKSLLQVNTQKSPVVLILIIKELIMTTNVKFLIDSKEMP